MKKVFGKVSLKKKDLEFGFGYFKFELYVGYLSGGVKYRNGFIVWSLRENFRLKINIWEL